MYRRSHEEATAWSPEVGMRRNGSAVGAGEGRTRARRRGGRLLRTWMGALVVAGVLVTPVDVEAPAAAQPATTATLTVTPADGLADGATVHAAGAGLTGWPVLVQCGADPEGNADCDWTTVTTLEPGAGGAFEVDHRVFALIHTDARGAVDCREAGACVLVASSYGADPLADAVSAPIAFDPDAPLLPSPAVTVSPNTDLLDGQEVHIDGRDFGHRLAPSPTGNVAHLYQCGPQPSFATCRALEATEVELAPDGSFAVQGKVWHVIRAEGQEIDCRSTEEPCLLVATTRPWETLDEPWAAGAPLVFDPDAPSLPTPEIEVTPAADLGDVTELTVRGRNFTPGGAVRVSVCDVAAPDQCDEATREIPTPGADGTFELRMNAFAAFGAGWEEEVSVDCRASGCTVTAEDAQSSRRATAPLGSGLRRRRGAATSILCSTRWRSTRRSSTGRPSTTGATRSTSGSTSTDRSATPLPAAPRSSGCTAAGSVAATAAAGCPTTRRASPGAAMSASMSATGCGPTWTSRTTPSCTRPWSTPTRTPRPRSSGCAPTPMSTASIRTSSWPVGSPPAP